MYSTEWMTGTTTAILLPQLGGKFNSGKVLTLLFTLLCSARVFWSIMDKIYLPFKFNILLNLMQFLNLFFVFHLGMLKHWHVYFTSVWIHYIEMFIHFCTPLRFIIYQRKFLTETRPFLSYSPLVANWQIFISSAAQSTVKSFVFGRWILDA